MIQRWRVQRLVSRELTNRRQRLTVQFAKRFKVAQWDFGKKVVTQPFSSRNFTSQQIWHDLNPQQDAFDSRLFYELTGRAPDPADQEMYEAEDSDACSSEEKRPEATDSPAPPVQDDSPALLDPRDVSHAYDSAAASSSRPESTRRALANRQSYFTSPRAGSSRVTPAGDNKFNI